MILTANSEVARQTARRKTGNGWHTTFIGENRNTLKQGEAPPEPGTLYPMAFLVEKDPHAVVKPHFHQADQYQVVVQGGGRLGPHDVGTVAVHYTDAWSAYGPIVAADEGISWFTLRNAWDSGARYMPAAREQLRAARAQNFQHREATAPPMPVASAERSGADRRARLPAVIEQTPDGMATWRYRLPPARASAAPLRATAAASSGSCCPARHPPAVRRCCRRTPACSWRRTTEPCQSRAPGAEALCLQFPMLARQ